MKTAGKLSSAERDKLAHLRSAGASISECARQLSRSKSTISEEIKRNRRWNAQTNTWVYEAIAAHEDTMKRRKKARTRPALKNNWLHAYVIDHLREGWSPEQIEGRLKREQGKATNSYHRTIGHEAIYQYIFDPQHKAEALWEYLPRKQKKRRKQKGRSVHKSRIPDRVSISARPEPVNTRNIFGHWEGDTVEGMRSVGDGVRTEVERMSRFLMVKKVERIASAETITAQITLFTPLPPHARRSETMDNGREHHRHTDLNSVLKMNTYFCHPYCSGERGTNENTNGLLRRYFPKGTDFSLIAQEDIDEVTDEINNRPRKVLQYQTPLEVFTRYLNDRSD